MKKASPMESSKGEAFHALVYCFAYKIIKTFPHRISSGLYLRLVALWDEGIKAVIFLRIELSFIVCQLLTVHSNHLTNSILYSPVFIYRKIA